MISPPAAVQTDLLRCPVHGEPLDASDPSVLKGVGHGETYPIIDGIPVLLPDRAERQRLLQTDWSVSDVGSSPIDFYNQTRDHDQYCRTELTEQRSEVEKWLTERRAAGPTLEIGSGKGAMQGVGGDYVALDYSLTALRNYLRPQWTRVCGTAEHLPFPDRSFSFIFTIAALEHVPNANLAFEEIDRVLMPGGIAFLAPAWHCQQYNCEGIPVRPYADLNLRQKLVKLSLPLHRLAIYKAIMSVPGRVLRRAQSAISGRPTDFHFKRLRPDYERFWLSDSDAASSVDSHECCLFYQSRGYEVLNPGRSVMQQLLCRHIGVVVRKMQA